MFNTNISEFGSIACGGLDLIDAAVDFDDLAFMQMVMCMQESDRFLSAKMKEIREMNSMKRKLTDHISRLNTALANSSADEDDEYVHVPGGLDNPVDPSDIPEGMQADSRQIESDWNEHKWWQEQPFNSTDKFYDWKTTQQAQALLDSMDVRAEQREVFKRSVVEAKIEELRGSLEDLNSSSSVMMIDLQRLMNKRSEAVQLVSNIESRSHKTAMSVIANFS